MLRSFFGQSGARRSDTSTSVNDTSPDQAPSHQAPRATLPIRGETAQVAMEPESAHWQAILLSRLSEWRLRAFEMPSTPDAALLVDALEEPSDNVIRQLPASAVESIAMCDSESISRSELASKLGKDPALVQGLLRTANSAAYSMGRRAVLSVDVSIERIGLRGARAVVMANCVEGLLSRPGGHFDTMVSDVWSHLVRTAPIARVIAPAFSIDRDDAFSVALLHDVGKLVVFDQLSRLRTANRRPMVVPQAWLSALIQDVHASLGALAALRWSMGQRAAIAIGDHHRADVTVGENEFAEVIYAAERFDHAQRKGEPLDIDDLWREGRLSGAKMRTAAAFEELTNAA
ncbi:MAG: HDOD domain-containing protein [bacterium]